MPTTYSNLIWYTISGLLLLLVQLNLGYITVQGVAPDLLVILIAVIALREGQFIGIIAAFMLGLAFDVISSNITGTNALAKVVAGFVIGHFYNEQLSLQQSIGTFRFLLIVAFGAAIHNLIFDFFYVQPTDLSLWSFFLRSGVAGTMYTVVVASLVMLVAARKKAW
ncbi:MAG: rod shape-determining protein MreD [Chlorobi bacterium]|nr:MAG: rod shape-determining protein MreD [Chlorobi bacterium OLB7]MBK8911512.1 rod shape-determining protein MreD [Chlorobiota bacterium]MBX7215788.1 rod shape-determining protein MreD [Candidatus Kapabacteria bacterium]